MRTNNFIDEDIMTLQEYLETNLSDIGLCSVLLNAATASIKVAHELRKGHNSATYAHSQNVHGEKQATLDLISHGIFLQALQDNIYVAGMLSEEEEEPIIFSHSHEKKSCYLFICDPLDGSSNLSLNISVGSIWTIYPFIGNKPTNVDFLQTGRCSLASAYVNYGHSTVLVLTIGQGVVSFLLSEEQQTFILHNSSITIPDNGGLFAINMSNQKNWYPAVTRYIRECLEGAEGVRQQSFNMRWVASMVADVHRMLVRGGIFLYPSDKKNLQGKLRVLYEAIPMAHLITQAGGASTTGFQDILDIQSQELHEKTSVILGEKKEVQLLEMYFKQHS